MSQIPDDLILGVIARRLDFVGPESLLQAAEMRSRDPSRNLEEVLGVLGLLDEDVRAALTGLIASLKERFSDNVLLEARSLEQSARVDASEPKRAAKPDDEA